MPKKVEERLKREAEKKGLTGDRKAAYVYGTMNRLGLLDAGKKSTKGGRKR